MPEVTKRSYLIDGKEVPGKFEDTEFGHVFVFDEPITVNNGEQMQITYIVIRYWEGCDPDGENADVAGSDHPENGWHPCA